MHRLALIVLASAALVIGGTALAGSPAAKERPRAAKVGGAGLLEAAADYLGLELTALRAELRQGRSLAQIATARGKSVDRLKQALLTAFRGKVQAAQSAGRIDASRAQKLLERATARVGRLVDARLTRARGAKVRAVKALLAVASDYLGVTRQQLATELRQGRSLAQVAAARGKSVDGLETALFNALKTRVDADVAAGELEATGAQRLLERAPAHIERLVNRTRG